MIDAPDQKTFFAAVIDYQAASADFIYSLCVTLGMALWRILGRSFCRALILSLLIFGR
jgi:hypothetical protein